MVTNSKPGKVCAQGECVSHSDVAIAYVAAFPSQRAADRAAATNEGYPQTAVGPLLFFSFTEAALKRILLAAIE